MWTLADVCADVVSPMDVAKKKKKKNKKKKKEILVTRISLAERRKNERTSVARALT